MEKILPQNKAIQECEAALKSVHICQSYHKKTARVFYLNSRRLYKYNWDKPQATVDIMTRDGWVENTHLTVTSKLDAMDDVRQKTYQFINFGMHVRVLLFFQLFKFIILFGKKIFFDTLFFKVLSIKETRMQASVEIKTKLEKVALDGSVECCAPPQRWCDLELWPFDPKTYSGHLCPETRQWQKFGENPSTDTGDIAETYNYRGGLKNLEKFRIVNIICISGE